MAFCVPSLSESFNSRRQMQSGHSARQLTEREIGHVVNASKKAPPVPAVRDQFRHSLEFLLY